MHHSRAFFTRGGAWFEAAAGGSPAAVLIGRRRVPPPLRRSAGPGGLSNGRVARSEFVAELRRLGLRGVRAHGRLDCLILIASS